MDSVVLLLQGIPSECFSFSLELFAFECVISGSCTIMRSPRNSPKLLVVSLYSSMISELCLMATLYVRLREIVALLSKTTEEGLTVQSFAIAISDFLHSYSQSLINIKSSIASRRKVESQLWNKTENNTELTLTEVYVFVLADFSKLKVLASLCGCNIVESKGATNSFSRRNYMALERVTGSYVASHWVAKMSKGAELLNRIYKLLIGGEHDLRYAESLRTLLKKSARPLFEFVARCIYSGEVVDPFAEFFVREVSAGKQRGLVLEYGKVPVFLEQYAEEIFR